MNRRVWIAFGLVLTINLILGVYYWAHKPITPAQAGAMAPVLTDAAVAALVTLAGGGLGRRLLRGWDAVSPGERIALEAALGWGVMGLAMLGLGLVKLYYSPLIWVLIALLMLLLRRDVWNWSIDLVRAVQAMQPVGRLGKLASMFVWLTLVLGLLRALAPPLMWDGLVYHLTLPKLYTLAHGLRIETEMLFSGMPQITEMVYLVAVLMRGPIAAQTLGWCFGAVLAVGLAAHTSELVGKNAGILATAILFSALTLDYELSWAYGDLPPMLLALAMVIALRQWRLSGSARWLVLSGVLAGLVVGCKYTAALVPLAAVGLIALTSRTSWKVRIRSIFILGGVALLVFAPWLIKNWLFTGNPVFPFLVPASSMDHLRQWFYSRPETGERNPLWAVLIFLRVSFLGMQSGNDYDATLGPLFVLLLVMLVAGWRKLDERQRNEMGPLAVFALVGYAGWVMLMFASDLAWQARLFFAIFPVLAILCVVGLTSVASFNTPVLRASILVNAAVALVLALTALENMTAFVARNPLSYVMGMQSALDYRTAHLGTHAVAIERVNALPPGSRVAFLFEARSLDCEGSNRCAPDVVIDEWWHLRRTIGNADAIITHWKAQGITHVLIYEPGADFIRQDNDVAYQDSDWIEFDTLKRQMRLAQDIQGVYSLYDLP